MSTGVTSNRVGYWDAGHCKGGQTHQHRHSFPSIHPSVCLSPLGGLCRKSSSDFSKPYRIMDCHEKSTLKFGVIVLTKVSNWQPFWMHDVSGKELCKSWFMYLDVRQIVSDNWSWVLTLVHWSWVLTVVCTLLEHLLVIIVLRDYLLWRCAGICHWCRWTGECGSCRWYRRDTRSA